jgi:single-strand DNA-binding protein
MSFNRIILVGNLGRDPELKYTPQGTAVCDFSLATNEKRKDQNGESKDETTWFRVTFWGRQAEVASQFLAKGRQAYIEGRLRTREWTDKDGRTRTSLEITGLDLQLLGSKPEEAAAAPKTEKPVKNGVARQALDEGINEEDIPFVRSGKKLAVNEEDDVPF